MVGCMQCKTWPSVSGPRVLRLGFQFGCSEVVRLCAAPFFKVT